MSRTKSWKVTGKPPRVLQTAIRRGLKMAASIGIDYKNDGSRITVTFNRGKR